MRVIPLIHNVSSVQRVVDMARLVYSLGINELVITKAYGAAAQHGIPEASKIALKKGRSLLVLPDIPDAVELLSPDKVLIVSFGHAKNRNLNEILDGEEKVILVAFNGGEPDFMPDETKLGKTIYIPRATSRLGPIAEAGIILYSLLVGREESWDLRGSQL